MNTLERFYLSAIDHVAELIGPEATYRTLMRGALDHLDACRTHLLDPDGAIVREAEGLLREHPELSLTFAEDDGETAIEARIDPEAATGRRREELARLIRGTFDRHKQVERAGVRLVVHAPEVLVLEGGE